MLSNSLDVLYNPELLKKMEHDAKEALMAEFESRMARSPGKRDKDLFSSKALFRLVNNFEVGSGAKGTVGIIWNKR
jgi:hypothetical protein